MKKLSLVVTLFVGLGLALPSLVKANNSNGIQPETAEGLQPNTPDSPSLTVPSALIQSAISRLSQPPKTTAGAEMTESHDSKSLTSPSVSQTENDGFSAPDAYAEYKYAQVQDVRPVGFDGPQHTGIVGFDFNSYWNTIVGFSFTYTNSNLDTGSSAGVGPYLQDSSNSYFMSGYVAKNFDDWINVGGSFTYGRTDNAFQSNTGGAAPTYFDQDVTEDSYSLAPFAGVAHTWGAFSFSSTPTYIWNYAHFGFDVPVPGGGLSAPPDAKTLNQTFLWLNNFAYAVDDKWTVSVQANWTRLLTIQTVQTTTPIPSPLANSWLSLGARADYAVNKDATVFAAFERDVLSNDFQSYRIRTGINYNF